MSGVLFPKVHVSVSSFVEIIRKEQKRREDCRKRLEEKAEFMLRRDWKRPLELISLRKRLGNLPNKERTRLRFR